MSLPPPGAGLRLTSSCPDLASRRIAGALYDQVMRTASLALLSLLVLACGDSDDGDGDGGQPGDPIAPAEAEELCGQFADHADSCGWGGNVNETDWNCGDAAYVWREDVFREFAACATDLPCDGDGSSCYQAVADTPPLAIHQDYAATCEDRSTACDLSPDTDTSTLILSCHASALALYANPTLESIIACFDQTCGDIVPCLDDTL
jgi:hypothetical protein